VPSLNTLTQEFGLSRNTVIKAISALEADGLVVTRQGRGTFVTRR
jgi:DNA-binding GntR family transcriptional regulator